MEAFGGGMADTPKNENDNATLVDLRLVPIAVVVSSGQVVERHWQMFKTTYFPGMSDELAQAALLAWAGRNNINAVLLTSYAGKGGALEISHVRLTKSS